MSYTMKEEMLFKGACALLGPNYTDLSDVPQILIHSAVLLARRVLAEVESYSKEEGNSDGK